MPQREKGVKGAPGSGGAIGAAALLLAVLSLAGPWAGALVPAGRAQDLEDLQRYQRRLEKLFRKLDTNGDGRLSPDEIRGHLYLESNFQRFDQGGKGYLLPSNLTTSPDKGHFLGNRLRQAFKRADRNGDGRLCGAEVAALPWLQLQANQADRNGDGCVSLEELWILRRSLSPRPQRDD